MKKILSSVTLIILCALTTILCACETNKTGTSSYENNSATVSKDSTKITELSVFDEKTSYIDSIEKIISGKVYTIKGMLKSGTMGLITESPITISVKDENNYYYSVQTVSSYQEYLVADGTAYILNSKDKLYAVSKNKTAQNIKSTIDTYFPSKDLLNYKDTYSVSYNNEEYIRERYEFTDSNSSNQTVSYFFSNQELKIIQYVHQVMEMKIDSYLNIESISLESDDSYYKKIKNYKKVSEDTLINSLNNSDSSDEYILELLDSMGITDDDLKEMGYTKEDILNMNDNQLSIFLAGLYGEDVTDSDEE